MRALSSLRRAAVLLFALGAAAAAGCSEGQVGLPGDNDVADMDDASGDTTGGGPDASDSGGGDTGGTPDTGGGLDTSMPPGDTGGGSDTTTGGCTSGAMRCSPFTDNVQTCQGGTWSDTETCGNGCRDGVCLPAAVSGTCTEPAAIAVGQSLVGTTDTLYNPNSWSQTCRSQYAMETGIAVSPTGPESVFALTVTAPSMLRITVDAIDPTYFALYVRSDCTDLDTELHSVCGAQNTPGGVYEVESFFAPGTYFLFVDDFGGDGNGPGLFELSVEQILLPECGGQIPTPLDVRSQINLSDDTATGISSEDWNGPECPVVQSTNGKEKVYVFGLHAPSALNVAALPTDPTTSKIGVYVRQDCVDRYSQVACGYTEGNAAATITSGTLPAGAYFLFVDDFIGSIDEEQAFDLTLEVNPVP